MSSIRAVFDRQIAAGEKLFVPYLMAGLTENWVAYVEAAIHAGADAVEIGIPFSDPMMDGPVIQEASVRALQNGMTLHRVLTAVTQAQLGVPVIVMTYYNVLLHHGLERAAGMLAEANVAGTILPDLSLEESANWHRYSTENSIENVLMTAPSTSRERYEVLAKKTEGFLYVAVQMSVTGSNETTESVPMSYAYDMLDTVPHLAGIGISTPSLARAATRTLHGAIVGSALVQAILGNATPATFGDLCAEFRQAIDE